MLCCNGLNPSFESFTAVHQNIPSASRISFLNLEIVIISLHPLSHSRFSILVFVLYIFNLPYFKCDHSNCVGLEVFSAMIIKCSFFWDITPSIPLKVELCLPPDLTPVTCSPYSSRYVLSKRLFVLQRTTWRCIIECRALHYSVVIVIV